MLQVLKGAPWITLTAMEGMALTSSKVGFRSSSTTMSKPNSSKAALSW